MYRTQEGESRMPAKLGAQCAFGMFIAILMTGIFQEARAEPVVLRPLCSARCRAWRCGRQGEDGGGCVERVSTPASQAQGQGFPSPLS